MRATAAARKDSPRTTGPSGTGTRVTGKVHHVATVDMTLADYRTAW
jgi:hypothetical protein